jgi:Flp pilus assembly protein TadD
MKKFLKVGLIIFVLSSLVAMPIKAAKYDKKKPSDLYTKAIEHLDKNQYGKAQKVLRIYTRKKKDDADGWTLLAFSSIKIGSYTNAEKYYEKALELDPENKAALEYQGELYVVTNRPQLANENLIKLESLCPKSCDELEKLQDFISSKIEKEKVNI